jgi:uncharacterized membrane protein HdeD (DUF308 family)
MSATTATTSTPRQRAAEAISGVWWLMLLRGILLLILGGYALFRPGMTAVALTQVLGLFVLADGIVALGVGLFGWTESRGWTIARGILGIVVGLFVLGHATLIAGITATAIMLLLAVHLIVAGFLEIAVAIRERKEIEGEGWLILGGALSIVLGLILAIAPFAASLVLIRILGGFTICFGIVLIVLAFRVRSIGKLLRR